MVLTNRFGLAPPKVLFDRICRDNGINHLLTALAIRPETVKSSASIERLARVPHREGFPLARRSAARARRQNRVLQHPATESHLRRDPRTPLLKSPRSKNSLFGIETAVSKMYSLIEHTTAFRTEQMGPAGGVATLILGSQRIYLIGFPFLVPLASPRVRSCISAVHEPFKGETCGANWFNAVCDLWRYGLS
jgi:hypothetical protein